MDRTLSTHLAEFIGKKILLVTGPRQCGKTTLAKMLDHSYDYLNFDNTEHFKILQEKSWDRKKNLIIFDELHKMKNWKQWLKGVNDVEGLKPALMVTGSAKLDTYRKVGDSLAGRYFQYRLHPFDLKELKQIQNDFDADKTLEKLLLVGGFPEPYLDGSLKFYNLWKKTHLDIILKQDLLEEGTVKDIRSIEILVELLKERVSSPISYSSLANDLQVSDKTIKHWLQVLENMYVIFKLTPFSKNIARSNLKQPKYYFYDVAQVKNKAAKLENIVACSLLKEVHFQNDCNGRPLELHYLSKKGGFEIDFLITQESKMLGAIEVKSSGDNVAENYKAFSNELADINKIQLVANLTREKTFAHKLEIRSLANWLAHLDLSA